MSAACPLCGPIEARPAGAVTRDGATSAFVRCPSCGLLFVWPRPSREAIHAYYRAQGSGTSYATLEERVRDEAELYDARFSRRLNEIARYASPPGKLLDVGCQMGLFLAAAQRRGWAVQGVELTEEAAAEARRRTGAAIWRGELAHAQHAAGSFDVVTCWHLIEHLLDPVALLREARRILKPGGLLALETPNIASSNFRRQGLEWEYVIPPEHINYFDAATLGRAVTQAGLEPCHQRYDRGSGVGRALQRAGLGAVRQWGRRHYRWVGPLRELYLATVGRLSPQEDILVMFARASRQAPP
jgi:2-polyprenyl-3-methyl-5-hydroxy-6-metoxy-1,4-benzoquinol methylase